jgi:hypothetical protein
MGSGFSPVTTPGVDNYHVHTGSGQLPALKTGTGLKAFTALLLSQFAIFIEAYKGVFFC